MGIGTYDLYGTKVMAVHPEHRRSLPSMASRQTVHPEHKKGLHMQTSRIESETVKGYTVPFSI